MALPRIHPLRKTFIELRRCAVRMDEFVARFDGEDTNKEDLYLEIYEKLKDLMDKIPNEYK